MFANGLLAILLPAGVFASVLRSANHQIPLTETQSVNTCSFSSYTAIGDSYSSGLGALKELPPCGPNDKNGSPTCTSGECKRDEGAYPYQFWKSSNIPKFQFLACQGYKTDDIKDKEVGSTGYGEPDLVTLTAGGGDNSLFGNVAKACIYNPLSTSAQCDKALTAGFAEAEKLPARYDALIGKIYRLRPNSTIVALSYVDFWGKTDARSCGLIGLKSTDAQKHQMNELADKLRQYLWFATYKHSRRHPNIYYIDMNERWQSHRLCEDGEQWFQRFNFGLTMLHPNEAGHQDYVRALKETLGCS